jgi:predicted GNAT superfamily acetyltransferase
MADMKPAVELQKTYWGDDLESVIPAHMLFSLANYGGHVLAAMDGERMAGVLVGFLGTNIAESDRPAMANLQIVSKRMVVLPEYRNQGRAYRLKLAQRDMAIKQGVRLVTWTFDPLLAPNAHLNIRKLGAVCAEFRENYYGTDNTGGLAAMGYSDRLFVEWWVTHQRVRERLDGSRRDLTLSQYMQANTPLLNPSEMTDDGMVLPPQQVLVPDGSMILVEIPANFTAIAQTNLALAQTWRDHIRGVLKVVMGMGYVVTDFIRETYAGRERAFYLLSHMRGQFDSNLN